MICPKGLLSELEEREKMGAKETQGKNKSRKHPPNWNDRSF